jgi:GNAT superfamily N-acetyltransferase
MNSEKLFGVGELAAYLLDETDIAAIQTLLEACDDYSTLVTGRATAPGDGAEVLADLPAGKELEDKFVLGLLNTQGEMVGLLDAVRAYPDPGVWFIGLMLIHPAQRGSGLGEHWLNAFEAWVVPQGAEAIMLGVLEENQKALRFWLRCGFERAGQRGPVPFGDKVHIILRMRRPAPYLVCRPMQDGEEAAVFQLVQRVFDRFEAPDYAPLGQQEFYKYANLQAYHERTQNHRIWVCLAGGRLAGMIEIRHFSHISLLFVEAEYHRKGLGRKLWQTALTACLEQNPDLKVVTVNSSPYALPVYERLGFRPTAPEQLVNGIRFIPMSLNLIK